MERLLFQFDNVLIVNNVLIVRCSLRRKISNAVDSSLQRDPQIDGAQLIQRIPQITFFIFFILLLKFYQFCNVDQVCSIFLFLDTTSIFYCQLGDELWTDAKAILKTQFTAMVAYMRSHLEVFRLVIQKHGCQKINHMLVLMPTLPPTGFHYKCRLIASNNELFRVGFKIVV